MGGMAFLAADTVLTVMAQQLGAPNWLIALLPTAMFAGLVMAPIMTASFIERSRSMKRITLFTGVPQRAVFLVAGIVIIVWGDDHPGYALAALALAPVLSGVFGGIGQGAWVQLVARTVPANRRSSLTATRNLIAACIGLGAGLVIKRVLDEHDGAIGFGILHLIAFGFLAASYIAFLSIQENIVEPVKTTRQRSLKAYFIELIDILRVDRDFRYFALMRVTGPAASFLIPFMTIYAIRVLGASEGFAGDALVAATLGQFVGNIGAGYMGDRLGGKALLVWARVLFLGAFLFAAFAQSYAAFMAYFFIISATNFVNIIGNMTLMMEIAPDHKRPTYGALAGLLNGPSMILFALAGSFLWTKFDSMQLQALIASIGMLFSLFFICQVKDPRNAKG